MYRAKKDGTYTTGATTELPPIANQDLPTQDPSSWAGGTPGSIEDTSETCDEDLGMLYIRNGVDTKSWVRQGYD